MASILDEIKKVLGVDPESTDFDTDIIMLINGAFFLLNDLGVGAKDFQVTDKNDQWEAFLEGRQDLAIVKSYVATVVRLNFDRPETSYGIQALERMRDEWGWRLEIRRREIANG